MIRNRYNGLLTRTRAGLIGRSCCCKTGRCYTDEEVIVCGAPDFDEFYRPQVGTIVDRWQPYCLRGLIYRNVTASLNANNQKVYSFDLNDYDRCFTLTRGIRSVDISDQCNIDLDGVNCFEFGKIINCNSTIDWRCVTIRAFDGLAAQIPDELLNVEHDVLVRVEYIRHVQGRLENGAFLFESGDIHLFEINSAAIFDF